ncbi:hypothetical protein BY996DRAFT_6532292 [Phakopsora pachyrhizi]|nr:hypothetical protein BY996DRAFT_6532292 [Phakopsora pachyrhizi]
MEDQSYDHDKSSTKVQSMKVVNFGIRERGIAGIRFHQSNDDLIQYPKPSNKSHLARIKKVYMRTGWTGIATTLLNFSLTSFVPLGKLVVIRSIDETAIKLLDDRECNQDKGLLRKDSLQNYKDIRKTEQWAGAARNVADRAELWESSEKTFSKLKRDECDQSSASTGMERLESVLQIVPIRLDLSLLLQALSMDLYSGPSRFDLEDSNPPKNGESGDGELGSGIIWQKWIIDGISLLYKELISTGEEEPEELRPAWSHLLDTDPPPFGPPTIISPHHIWNLVLVDELLFSLDGTDPKVIVYIAFSELAMVTTKGAGDLAFGVGEWILEEMGRGHSWVLGADESWHSQGTGLWSAWPRAPLRMGVMEEAQ